MLAVNFQFGFRAGHAITAEAVIAFAFVGLRVGVVDAPGILAAVVHLLAAVFDYVAGHTVTFVTRVAFTGGALDVDVVDTAGVLVADFVAADVSVSSEDTLGVHHRISRVTKT